MPPPIPPSATIGTISTARAIAGPHRCQPPKESQMVLPEAPCLEAPPPRRRGVLVTSEWWGERRAGCSQGAHSATGSPPWRRAARPGGDWGQKAVIGAPADPNTCSALATPGPRSKPGKRDGAHLRPLGDALGIAVAPGAGLCGLGEAQVRAAGARGGERPGHQAAAGHLGRPGDKRLPPIELPRVLLLAGARNCLHTDGELRAIRLLAVQLGLAAPATPQRGSGGELVRESHVRSTDRVHSSCLLKPQARLHTGDQRGGE